ncbi:hypothetical protein TI39_contig5832g00020 [Zymoseptoria brevis]|uniref:Calcineurin-like phosphoesterase domain-containing protein n=1 Tax=Zymoseptoria brevis TaxID=1047168 RepID=A0A0F4G8V6_9PEZI|nr:hypothetical protein TI39_contig5832g00020 [Zymoseptoria brevis]
MGRELHSLGDDDQPLSQLQARLHAAATSPTGHTTCSPPFSAEEFPLIHQVDNKWQQNALTPADLEDHDQIICDNLSTTRRIRRLIAFTIFLVVATFYIFSQHVRPSMEEEWAYEQGFLDQTNGTYGVAKAGKHYTDPDLTRMKRLDPALLPGGSGDEAGKRRLVFIGDVHGCKKELLKLLRKVDFNEDLDHLVLVGDTVSKGPDNVGVLDELIRLNATSVRGNHEDRLLVAAKSMLVDGEMETTDDEVEESRSKGSKKDRKLLEKLKPKHLDYMRDMPLMLHIPSLPLASKPTNKWHSPIAEHILVVHAGLVPGVELEKQDPYFVINMRSINRKTHLPSVLRADKKEKDKKPWFDVWNWYNSRIFKGASMEGFKSTLFELEEEIKSLPDLEPSMWIGDLWKSFFGKKKKHGHLKPQVVIYGHDSHEGLQLNRWSKGLDSACVAGGRLTAMVVDAKGRQEVVSVGCKNYKG